MKTGEEESGPSNKLVQFNTLIEGKQEGDPCRADQREYSTEHQDDHKCRIEIQALTTATCYGDSWTLRQERGAMQIDPPLSSLCKLPNDYLIPMPYSCFHKQNDVDDEIKSQPNNPSEVVSEIVQPRPVWNTFHSSSSA